MCPYGNVSKHEWMSEYLASGLMPVLDDDLMLEQALLRSSPSSRDKDLERDVQFEQISPGALRT